MRYLLRRLCSLVLLITVVLAVIFGTFRMQYRDAIRSLSHTQVMNATSDLINDAIDQQIESGNIQYDRIVDFEKDLDGKITAIEFANGITHKFLYKQ